MNKLMQGAGILIISLLFSLPSAFGQDDCANGVTRYKAFSYTHFNSGFSAIAFRFRGDDCLHTYWHFNEDAYLDVYADGSALLHGSAVSFGSLCEETNGELWNVHVELLASDPFTPKDPKGDPDYSLWDWFQIDEANSYLSNPASGWTVPLLRRGDGAQMGQGANGKTDTFGFSTWFNYYREDGVRKGGDFNFDIELVPCDDCNECDGKVTDLTLKYLGTEVNPLIEVIQKKDDLVAFAGIVPSGDSFSFEGLDKHGTLGTEIIVLINGEENARLHTSCSQPIGPGIIAGDFEVTSGASRNGGNLCPAEDNGGSESYCCDGKVNYLELRYNGPDGVSVEVYQKKDMVLAYTAILDNGDEFSVSGLDNKGTLSTEIIFYEDGVTNAKMHTSCSAPIGPGLIAGNFEVLGGTSRNGGDLCPVDSNSNRVEIGSTTVFPNPFKKDVKVEISGAENLPFTYSIVDEYGELIVEAVNSITNDKGRAKIKTKDLPEGMYYLIIEINGVLMTHTISKNQ